MSEASPDPSRAVVTDRTQLQIPSQTDWIGPTLEFLRQRLLAVGACDEMQADRLVMGLHEGLTNAIVHGNLEIPSALKEAGDAFARLLASRLNDPVYNVRTVSVGVDYDGQRCQWVIADEGAGFDVESVLRRLDDDPENSFLASGRGILMMRAFFDEVRWEAGGRRLIVTWSAPPDQEQRRHPRWPLHRKARVAPIRADGSVDWTAANEAVTRNLSAGGTLLLQQTLARAERVMVALDVDGAAVYLPAQVRRCTPLPDGTIELGCCFQADAGPEVDRHTERVREAIDGLLAQVTGERTVSDERREHPRVAYPESVAVLPTASEAAVTGYGQDLSRGGIKFIVTRQLACGVRTLVLPQVGTPGLRVRAQILRCLQIAEGFYDVAARFVDGDE